jgi:hypothetical protein
MREHLAKFLSLVSEDFKFNAANVHPHIAAEALEEFLRRDWSPIVAFAWPRALQINHYCSMAWRQFGSALDGWRLFCPRPRMYQ